MGNTNPYAGKPRHGREICRLMRDANKIETALINDDGHAGPIYSVAFSPDGTKVLTGSNDGTAKLWDVTTGTVIKTYGDGAYRIFSASFTPDGTWILVSSEDNIILLDVSTGVLIRTFTGYGSASLSPDGTKVLTGSSGFDNAAYLLDIYTGDIVQSFSGHVDAVFIASFSPDGTKVLTGSNDGTAKLWDVTTGTVIKTFNEAPIDAIMDIAIFSPDGTKVLTAYSDGTIKLWNALTGLLLLSFAVSLDDYFLDAIFSSSGSQILISQMYSGISVVESNTGNLLNVVSIHPYGIILGMAASHDGTKVLTGDSSGFIRLSDYPQFNAIQSFAPNNAPQTTFYGYAETTKNSLGTPDGGQTIPSDTAIDEYPLVYNNIAQLQTAIEGIVTCGLIRCPDTDQPYNLSNGNPSNLHFLAMGDRTKYGATGGPRYNWTRTVFNAIGTPPVDIDIGDIYECIELLKTAAGV